MRKPILFVACGDRDAVLPVRRWDVEDELVDSVAKFRGKCQQARRRNSAGRHLVAVVGVEVQIRRNSGILELALREVLGKCRIATHLLFTCLDCARTCFPTLQADGIHFFLACLCR